MPNSDQIVKNTTCFAEHKKRNLTCLNSQCRYYLDYEDDLNCTMISLQNWADQQAEKRGDGQVHHFMDLTSLAERIKTISRAGIWQCEKRVLRRMKRELFGDSIKLQDLMVYDDNIG